MSNKERAIQLLNTIDDEKMIYVVGILENLTNLADIPNEETVAAIKEGDEAIQNGTGQQFEGTTRDFFHKLLTPPPVAHPE